MNEAHILSYCDCKANNLNGSFTQHFSIGEKAELDTKLYVCSKMVVMQKSRYLSGSGRLVLSIFSKHFSMQLQNDPHIYANYLPGLAKASIGDQLCFWHDISLCSTVLLRREVLCGSVFFWLKYTPLQTETWKGLQTHRRNTSICQHMFPLWNPKTS